MLIPAQRDVISRIASALVAVDVRGAKVEGHTDNTGTTAYNEQLSQKRAQAVADALAAGGMAPAALHPVGMGLRVPVASNDSEVGTVRKIAAWSSSSRRTTPCRSNSGLARTPSPAP
ncbi:OmpA family protein [Sphingobium scionense]